MKRTYHTRRMYLAHIRFSSNVLSDAIVFNCQQHMSALNWPYNSLCIVFIGPEYRLNVIIVSTERKKWQLNNLQRNSLSSASQVKAHQKSCLSNRVHLHPYVCVARAQTNTKRIFVRECANVYLQDIYIGFSSLHFADDCSALWIFHPAPDVQFVAFISCAFCEIASCHHVVNNRIEHFK